jgi:single-strand DNA-binding protein
MGIATSYVYNNQQTGQKVESTEFHNVVLWRKLGEIAAQYLKKGQQVYIEGRLQTRSWDGADGQKRYKTEIVADNMIMLGSKGGPTGSAGSVPTGTSYNNSNNAGYQVPSSAMAKPASVSPAQDMSQMTPQEEIPTIQQGEDISVEDIPF